MDPSKISTVQEWPQPENVKDVQSFLGFANFYRRFVQGYSKIVQPLTMLTRKEIPFVWGETQIIAFETLKKAFTTAPILQHFNPEKEIIVETDASDYVSAGVLSQYDDNQVLHPIAFFSKKHTPAECNYEIYDKELLAIIRAFEEWRPELEGATHPIQVLTDHRNLEYFMSSKLLNRRQARWSEFLSRFNFKIVYRPGKAGQKPDSLTRRSGDLPKEGDERLCEQQKAVLKPQNLPQELHLLANTSSSHAQTHLDNLFKEGYEIDPFPSSVIADIKQGTRQRKDISLALCSVRDGRLYIGSRLLIPDYAPLRLYLLQQHHDTPVAGHQGREKTFELLSRDYYWSTMRRDVEKFVRNCHTCARIKTSRHLPFGELKPLPVPKKPWQDIAWDFVTGLPNSNGKNSILVVIDRLTKARHLIPCNEDTSARDLADLFVQNVWRLHGLPDTITSDRGSLFASEFWTQVCKRLGIQPRLSTAFHPETDGQTERSNAQFEAYLRAYVNYLQDDWAHYLPMAEFVANNTVSESTGVTPFYANHGQHPKLFFDLSIPSSNTEAFDAESHVVRLREIHETAKINMLWAQDKFKEYADRRRLPAPAYQNGDLVWLNKKNITTTRPCTKLDWKKLGPFRVIEAIGTHAYKLELPPSMKCHPVFHVSLLDPASSDPYPGQIEPPPPPIIIEDEEEWVVEKIEDSRMFGRWKKLQYLVKWKGYPDVTWEPAEDINGLAAIDQFHETYPEKPGPLPEEI